MTSTERKSVSKPSVNVPCERTPKPTDLVRRPLAIAVVRSLYFGNHSAHAVALNAKPNLKGQADD